MWQTDCEWCYLITHIYVFFGIYYVSFHISLSNVFLSGIMQVIEANPANAKALYRRGMAYMTLGDFEDARNDFEMVKVYTFQC